MKRLMLGGVTFMLIVCSAGAALAQQASGPCEKTPPSDPAYYADMKLMPEGKYFLSYMGDRAQFDDASTPVVVRGLAATTSSKERSGKLTCAEVENRTGRAVKSLALRWAVTKRADDGSTRADAEVLARGLLPPVHAALAPGERRKVELTGAHFADFVQPVAAAGPLEGSYHVSVSVARVEFADGTSVDVP
ncbi:MAG TPA: hypothetical protein VF570_03770 [Pyrinomonadaceae bacterium]